MVVLVIGANGFVGRHLVAHLTAQGITVRGLVRSVDRARASLPRDIELQTGELGDPNAIARAARGVDAIVIAAGIRDDHAPLDTLKWTHVAGVENVIRAARFAKVPRLVHISGADCTLIHGSRVNWHEEKPLLGAPLGARAQTLLLGEELALSAADAQLHTVALRPAWLWPDRERLRKECTATGGLRLFGRGANLFASTHIDNLCHAAALALRADSDASGRAYFIADGEFQEAREFFTQLCSALGTGSVKPTWWQAWMSQLGNHPDRFERIRRAVPTMFDTQRAWTDLGWEPIRSVADGMARLRAASST